LLKVSRVSEFFRSKTSVSGHRPAGSKVGRDGKAITESR
jgi:hypothetical protein